VERREEKRGEERRRFIGIEGGSGEGTRMKIAKLVMLLVALALFCPLEHRSQELDSAMQWIHILIAPDTSGIL
jgi:hypothetical protein